ncbi:MAG: hypothetical protein RQ824_01710 [bacterium]|nr:hypothetical protein [bacterium]
MNYLKNLSDSDKKTLKMGGVALSVLLYLILIIFPLKERANFYEKQIIIKTKAAQDMAGMALRYKTLNERFDELMNSAKEDKGSFTLFSFLDGAAADSNLKERIKGMKPTVISKDNYTESTVAVELEDVDIKSLTSYIHMIESSGHNLKIRKVDIKPRYSAPENINVTLIISAISMKR